MDGNTIIARSERLLIRRFVAGDAKGLASILSDPMVVSRLSIDPVETIEAAEHYLVKNYLSKYEAADSGEVNEFGLPIDYRFAICLPEMDNRPERLIGRIGISSYGNVNNVGYYLDSDDWGKGYASEAFRLMQRVCCEKGYPYLTATCGEDNASSERVMRASGMSYRYSYFDANESSVASVFYQIDFREGVDTYLRSMGEGATRWIDGLRVGQ